MLPCLLPKRASRGLTAGEDGLLISELLENLGSTGHAIARLASRDVENELLDLHLPHGVVISVRPAQDDTYQQGNTLGRLPTQGLLPQSRLPPARQDTQLCS